jgi:hypothetical protein
MKNKFMVSLVTQNLIKSGYNIYYEDSNSELVIEKDGQSISFKSENKFQEWINKTAI